MQYLETLLRLDSCFWGTWYYLAIIELLAADRMIFVHLARANLPTRPGGKILPQGAGARPTDQTAMVQLQGMCIAYTCQMPKKSLVTPIWFSIEVLQSSYFLIVCFCHSVAPEVLPSGLLRWCNRGGRGVKSGGGSRSNFLRQISTLDFPYECHVVTP